MVIADMKYVLITPARNEERFIAKTLDSMVAQTLLPERWVIVDDGSTDRTAELVQSYSKRFPWIELVQRAQPRIGSLQARFTRLMLALSEFRHFPLKSSATWMRTYPSIPIIWNS